MTDHAPATVSEVRIMIATNSAGEYWAIGWADAELEDLADSCRDSFEDNSRPRFWLVDVRLPMGAVHRITELDELPEPGEEPNQ